MFLLACQDFVSSTNWLDNCRSSGFEPAQLACNTCRLLSDTIQATCLECCQSYLDVERITKPFQSAIVVLMTPTVPQEGELGNFFKDDWNEVYKIKTDKRLMKIIDESASSLKTNKGLNNMYMNHPLFQFMSFNRQTAEILFFDEPMPRGSSLNYQTLMNKSKETMPLDGMKREDIKDMIMTLLPSS